MGIQDADALPLGDDRDDLSRPRDDRLRCVLRRHQAGQARDERWRALERVRQAVRADRHQLPRYDVTPKRERRSGTCV